MATIGGNNSVRDGLVFYYDTGNKYRSFKGAPTINQITNQANFAGSSVNTQFVDSVWHMTIPAANTGNWRGIAYSSQNAVSSPGDVCYFSFEVKSGGPYTVPVFVDVNNGGLTTSTGTNDNDKNRVYNFGDAVNYEWRRFHAKYEFDSNLTQDFYKYNRIIMANGHNPGFDKTLLIRNIQEEVNTVLTPFTLNTRTSTESLFDLVGDTSLDMSNMLYDSNGKPLFDNDASTYIDFGSDKVFKTGGGWTIETITKFNWVPGAYTGDHRSPGNFLGCDAIHFNSWYWSVLNNKLAIWNLDPGVWKYGSTILQAGKYYHCVITCSDDGTSYQMYLDGVPEGGDHATYSFNPAKAGLRYRYVGTGNGSVRFLDGEQPVVKLYDKQLTAQEVKRNYNSYKNRFGL